MKRFLLAALLVAGCAPETAGPVDAVVLGLETGQGFSLRQRSLETIDSVADARGNVAKLIKEARLTQDTTIENELLQLSFDGGEPVKVLHTLDNGLVIPADYDSLVLLSFYSHLEDSVDYHRSLGLNVDAFLPITTHVAPELGFVLNLELSDNAAYLPTHNVFFVLPEFLFRDHVPLGSNDGVVSHEFGHAVFHYTLNHQNADPRIPNEANPDLGWAPPAGNYLRSLNEGLADVFALMRTQEADFIALSIPAISEARNAATRREYTTEMRDNILNAGSELEGEDPVPFSPYDLGAVVASAMWKIADDPANGVGFDRGGQMAYDALDATRTASLYQSGDFTISVYLNLLVAAATVAERPHVCAVIDDQFAIIAAEIIACP